MNPQDEVKNLVVTLSKEEANKLIAEKLEQIQILFQECKQLANDNDCYFEYQLLSEHEVQVLESQARQEGRDSWEHSGC